MGSQYQEKGISQDIDGDVIDLKKDKNVIVEGVYQGSKTFDGKRAGEMTTLHYVKVGQELKGFWGAKDLNEKLMGEEGKSVRVQFKEKKTLRDGRSKNIFTVLIAG